jgi:hypothetical protein
VFFLNCKSLFYPKLLVEMIHETSTYLNRKEAVTGNRF